MPAYANQLSWNINIKSTLRYVLTEILVYQLNWFAYAGIFSGRGYLLDYNWAENKITDKNRKQRYNVKRGKANNYAGAKRKIN